MREENNNEVIKKQDHRSKIKDRLFYNSLHFQYELESNSTIVQNLRRVIMDGKCDGKTKIMDKTKTEVRILDVKQLWSISSILQNDYYLCKSFPSTPLTLVIFSSHNVPSYDYTGPPIPSSQLTTPNPMVQYLISKRYKRHNSTQLIRYILSDQRVIGP